MAGGELRLGTASMYMAGVYHNITTKSINKYPFTWLHICGQTKTSRAKSVASCFGMKEDQTNGDSASPAADGDQAGSARDPQASSKAGRRPARFLSAVIVSDCRPASVIERPRQLHHLCADSGSRSQEIPE